MAGALCSFVALRPQLTRDNILSMLGFAAILLSVFWFDDSTPFPSLWTLVPVIGTCLVLVFGLKNTAIASLLSTRLLVGTGLISYSAYLWHQPLFAFARIRSLSEPSQILMLALGGVSIILAYFSWRFVEMPFREKKSTINQTAVFSFATISSSIFLVFGLWEYVRRGSHISEGPVIASLLSQRMNIYETQVKDCWQRFNADPTIRAACIIGNPSINPSFALLGDSHAGALLHEFDDSAKILSIAGLNYTARSCSPFIRGVPVKFSDGEELCVSFRKSFFGAISGSSIPNTVIVNARWTLLIERKRFDNEEGGIEQGSDWLWDLGSHDEDYQQAMVHLIQESIKTITRSGRKVILIYPVPEMGWDVPVRLSKIARFNNELSSVDASTSYQRFLVRNKSAIEALDGIGNYPNLIRIRPDKMFCDSYIKDRCVAHLNGVSLYYDNNHLSNFGASLIVREAMGNIANGVQ